MIDEKINKSLQELETQLKEVESARKQVQNTVNSFDGLNTTTSNYVSSLNSIKTKLDEVVELVGIDYNNKVNEFEKERATIIKASSDVISKLDAKIEEITEAFNTNVKSVQNKLLYSLILNAITIVAIILYIFLI